MSRYINRVYNSLELNNVDNMYIACKDIIDTYIQENNISSGIDILPNVFNYLMLKCNDYVFKDNIYLRNVNFQHNDYNIQVIEDIYKYVYIRICLEYNKAVTMYSFSLLTGIAEKTFIEWFNTGRCQLQQTIRHDQESSLQGLLLDKSYNPMKVLPILNHWHDWQTAAAASGTRKPALSVEKLPELSKIDENKPQLLE